MQNGSFFADGKPGNLARIFAAIDCESREEYENKEKSTVVIETSLMQENQKS